VPDLVASARGGLYEIMIVAASVAIDSVASIARTPLEFNKLSCKRENN